MRTDVEIIRCLFALLQQDPARTVISAELAQSMSLSRASMHHRVEKLVKMDLLLKTGNKKIRLTEKGLAYAYQLHDQHDEIKAFFEATCGLHPADADRQAAVLVAELSDEARNQMCAVICGALLRKRAQVRRVGRRMR